MTGPRRGVGRLRRTLHLTSVDHLEYKVMVWGQLSGRDCDVMGINVHWLQ